MKIKKFPTCVIDSLYCFVIHQSIMKTLITTAVLFTGLAWSRGSRHLVTPHKSNKLQKHAKFITVHGRWAGVVGLFLSIINKLNFYNWLVIAAMLEL